MNIWSGIVTAAAAFLAILLLAFVLKGHWILALLTLPGTIGTVVVAQYLMS